MKTLVIETSAEVGSVAVVEDGRLLVERQFTGGRGHAALLFPLLEKVLGEFGPIDAVATGVGPGGYSGLRVGISAALGLKLGLGIPATGICSVLGYPSEHYQVVIDARGSWIFAEIQRGLLIHGPSLSREVELAGRLNAQIPIYSARPIPGNFPTIAESPRAAMLAQRLSPENELPLAAALSKAAAHYPGKTETAVGPAATGIKDARVSGCVLHIHQQEPHQLASDWSRAPLHETRIRHPEYKIAEHPEVV